MVARQLLTTSHDEVDSMCEGLAHLVNSFKADLTLEDRTWNCDDMEADAFKWVSVGLLGCLIACCIQCSVHSWRASKRI